MASKKSVKTFTAQDILNRVKNGTENEARFHAENVKRLLKSGDRTYSEYIPHLADIDKQLRQKSRVVLLPDGNFLSKDDAWNIRKFFREWEQARRDYERVLAAFDARFNSPT